METPDNNRLIRPKSILVATNLSDLPRLMPFALQMASESVARLYLLHAIPASAEFAADPTGMPYYDPRAAIAEADNMLEPWCERAKKLGLQCGAIIRDATPVAREILETAHQLHPDLLIQGTRSLNRLGKLLLGSVAEQVLRSASLPVFTIGPEAHLEGMSGRQPTILFATTLGDGHYANAALACQFATARGARLVILHVLPSLCEGQRNECNVLVSTVTYELEHLAHRIGAGSDTDVEIKVAHGNPSSQILSEAADIHADLIVMGATDHSLFESIAHDRTVCGVLAHAHCPVLSLHGIAAEQRMNGTEAAVVH